MIELVNVASALKIVVSPVPTVELPEKYALLSLPSAWEVPILNLRAPSALDVEPNPTAFALTVTGTVSGFVYDNVSFPFATEASKFEKSLPLKPCAESESI